MSAPILWTAAEAAAATGGTPRGDWAASGVSIDTRTLAPGDLFVALSDRRDGHDFVAKALAQGAAAAMVSRVPEGVGPDAPLLVVDDVQAALEALGQAGRARSGARVIAVTGSVGKTSTKEMLRAILSGQGRVHAAEASFNNHWGVPLTLARLPVDADFAVIEIGMNHPGEIAPLARQARPHVALVTTVAPAHLAAFPDVAAIAHEKAQIFEGLEQGGVAVVPADLDTSPILLAAAAARAGSVTTFGHGEDADYRLRDHRLAEGVAVVRAEASGKPFLLRLAATGLHFATNALGALAAAAAAGADLGVGAGDLGRWTPPAGRGRVERVPVDAAADPDHALLIDDAFNANPASVRAALDVLAAHPLPVPRAPTARVGGGRRVAILGDMLELGPDEASLHAGLAALGAMARIDVVHCVGPRMRNLWQALPASRQGLWTETAAEMAARVGRLVAPGDVVLVKGSKGSAVSTVVDAIRKLGQGGPRTT